MSVYPKSAYAGFWRRFVAFLIDTTLVSVVAIGIRMVTGANPFLETIPQQSVIHFLFARLFWPYLAGLVLIVLCWVLTRGRSPGKWLMHIRIVKADNQPIDFLSAVIRYVGYALSSLFANGGYLLMLFDGDRQTVHDKLAKTYVIVDGDAKPSPLAYVVGLLGPVALLGMYFWLMLVSHGLVVTPSDLRARYKDFQFVRATKQIKPDVQAHMDKAQGYLDEVKGINSEDPDYANKVRPIARQAVEELKLARGLDPNNALIYSKLSSAYSRLDGTPAAEKSYEAALMAYQMDPTDRHYAYNLGNVLIQLGRYEEAVTMLQKAITLDHTFTFAYQALGVAYQRLKQNDKAIANYKKAIEFYTKTNGNGENDQAIAKVQGYITDLSK